MPFTSQNYSYLILLRIIRINRNVTYEMHADCKENKNSFELNGDALELYFELFEWGFKSIKINVVFCYIA